MNFSVRVPKILFIKGVFKKDCVLIDDFFEKQLVGDAMNECSNIDNINSVQKEDYPFQEINSIQDNRINYYNKLPTIFENINMWPTQTNLLCWYCSLSFDTMPVFIPKIIEPTMRSTEINEKNKNTHTCGKFIISVYGVFCTFSCAIEYVNSHYHNLISRIETLNKIKFLHKYMLGEDMPAFTNYPSPFLMTQYGGDINQEQYKEMIKHYNHHKLFTIGT
jgi:hypothetical protein